MAFPLVGGDSVISCPSGRQPMALRPTTVLPLRPATLPDIAGIGAFGRPCVR